MLADAVAEEMLAETMTFGDVALRPFAVADVTEAYVSWLNDADVVRYTEARWQTHTIASARQYVEESVADTTAELFRILLGERHVGNLRLSGIDLRHRRCEIALIIGEKDAWGLGVGSRAISIATAHAFRGLSLVKVTAGIYATNLASLRSFQKAGFHLAASFRGHFTFEGGRVDGLVVERLSPLEQQG